MTTIHMTTAQKPWHLYLLECRGGVIYTGIALDVAARLAQHREGIGAKFTRMHPPLRLLASEMFPNRAAASRAEWAMKQKSAAEKWAWVAMQEKSEG